MLGKFWMVLGRNMPVVRHASKESAKKEAERLAKLIPGEEFTVLESVATCRKHEVEWETHQHIDVPGDGIPF